MVRGNMIQLKYFVVLIFLLFQVKVKSDEDGVEPTLETANGDAPFNCSVYVVGKYLHCHGIMPLDNKGGNKIQLKIISESKKRDKILLNSTSKNEKISCTPAENLKPCNITFQDRSVEVSESPKVISDGSDVNLTCITTSVFDVGNVTITWSDLPIGVISKTNKDKNILTIYDVKAKYNGLEVTCTATDPLGLLGSDSVNLVVNQSSFLNIYAIAGGSAGLVIVILLCIIIYLVQSRRNANQQNQSNSRSKIAIKSNADDNASSRYKDITSFPYKDTEQTHDEELYDNIDEEDTKFEDTCTEIGTEEVYDCPYAESQVNTSCENIPSAMEVTIHLLQSNTEQDDYYEEFNNGEEVNDLGDDLLYEVNDSVMDMDDTYEIPTDDYYQENETIQHITSKGNNIQRSHKDVQRSHNLTTANNMQLLTQEIENIHMLKKSIDKPIIAKNQNLCNLIKNPVNPHVKTKQLEHPPVKTRPLEHPSIKTKPKHPPIKIKPEQPLLKTKPKHLPVKTKPSDPCPIKTKPSEHPSVKSKPSEELPISSMPPNVTNKPSVLSRSKSIRDISSELALVLPKMKQQTGLCSPSGQPKSKASVNSIQESTQSTQVTRSKDYFKSTPDIRPKVDMTKDHEVLTPPPSIHELTDLCLSPLQRRVNKNKPHGKQIENLTSPKPVNLKSKGIKSKKDSASELLSHDLPKTAVTTKTKKIDIETAKHGLQLTEDDEEGSFDIEHTTESINYVRSANEQTNEQIYCNWFVKGMNSE